MKKVKKRHPRARNNEEGFQAKFLGCVRDVLDRLIDRLIGHILTNKNSALIVLSKMI